jgi:hypothetical protein
VISNRALAELIEQDILGSLDRGLMSRQDAELLATAGSNRQSAPLVAYVEHVRAGAQDAIRAFPGIDPGNVAAVTKLQAEIAAFLSIMQYARTVLASAEESRDVDDTIGDDEDNGAEFEADEFDD